jgi:hypothetical protein
LLIFHEPGTPEEIISRITQVVAEKESALLTLESIEAEVRSGMKMAKEEDSAEPLRNSLVWILGASIRHKK